MFILCRTCAEQFNEKSCTHSEDQRAFTGTWVLDEIKLALEMNYRVVEAYVVWEFNVTQYNKKTGEGGLFPNYINHFARLKTQASGFPSHIDTNEKKIKYITDFKKNEGIDLNFNEIERNPALRWVSKLLVTSLWGKFGQQENKPQTTIVKNPAELYEFVSNPEIVINTVEEAGEDMFYINWQYQVDNYMPNNKVNPVVAAFTTSAAGIRLYRILVKLGSSVCYYDTDSVIINGNQGITYHPLVIF